MRANQMLDYLSQMHKDNVTITETKLALEESRLELEKTKLN